MKKPAILILCGGRFAFPAIQQLAVEGYLCGVVMGKADKQSAEFMEQECLKAGLSFLSIDSSKEVSKLEKVIDELKPDAVFSICFPYLLPESVLSYGADKFINFHTGPLPSYRGPVPIFEVLRYSEPETAVTVHFMDAAFDEGAIIFSERISISEDDTFGILAEKLSVRSAMAAQNMAEMLEFGSSIPRQPQTNGPARYFEKPELEDTLIQWRRMSANQVHALVRACNPWNGGADSLLNGRQVKIVSASLSDKNHQSTPGTILGFSEETGLSVACIDHCILDIHIISGESGILTASQFVKLRPVIGHSFN